MSLISDALKRQEQLRAPGTAQPEVAAAKPPEVAAAKPPEVSRISAQPRRASDATSRGRAAPNFAAPAAQPRAALPPHKPSNRQTVKPSNPFIERERAAARRPSSPVLLMPVIGLLMLLVLLFLRREFVPSQPSQAVTVKKVESEKWEVESSGGPGAVPAATPVDNPADAAVLSDLFPEEAESLGGPDAVPAATSAENPGGPGIVPAAIPVDIPKTEPSAATETTKLSTSNSLRPSSASAPLRENPPPPEPSNAQTVKPSNQAVETPPQQPAWPSFALTGIAVGRERIAVLSTGEMLLAGETAKCGVKVKKVNASTVVFAWGGETKTLRKGEHSDKPAD